jgi:predicted aspartyl protease
MSSLPRCGASRQALLRASLAFALLVITLTGLSACTVNLRSSAPTVCDQGISAPVDVKKDFQGNTLVLVSVTLEGQGPYVMALDTGASKTLLDRSVVAKLQLPVAGPPQEFSGIGGKQQATPVRIGAWNIGQIKLPASEIASIALGDTQRSVGIVGFLGSDLMSRFGLVSIDYNNNTLTVYKQIAASDGQPLAAAGRASW